jgi:hypothetical protein
MSSLFFIIFNFFLFLFYKKRLVYSVNPVISEILNLATGSTSIKRDFDIFQD